MRDVKTTIIALASTCILLVISTSIQASFMGHDIRASAFFPEIGTFVGEPEIATVTSSQEFTFFPTALPLLNADFGDATLDIVFVINSGVASGDFGGVVFDDIFDTIPSITAVTLLSSSNPEIDISRISFDQNSIALNFQGVGNVSNNTLSLAVTFVPIPGALILLLSGSILLGGLAARSS